MNYNKKYRFLVLDKNDMAILKCYLEFFAKDDLEAKDAKRILKILKSHASDKNAFHKTKGLKAIKIMIEKG